MSACPSLKVPCLSVQKYPGHARARTDKITFLHKDANKILGHGRARKKTKKDTCEIRRNSAQKQPHEIFDHLLFDTLINFTGLTWLLKLKKPHSHHMILWADWLTDMRWSTICKCVRHARAQSILGKFETYHLASTGFLQFWVSPQFFKTIPSA